jgi:ATP-dependent 26S proteasome regulatory subunit
MPRMSIQELLRMAGVDLRNVPFEEEDVHRFGHYLEVARQNPTELVAELVRKQAALRQSLAACERSAGAAAELEQMLKRLLDGNATFYHLQRLRETPAGPRAVCRLNGSLREFTLHPEMEVQQLRDLKSWEYVTVHQDVVIGCWADDPLLRTEALGQVVEFKGYQDREAHTVRIVDGPQERIAVLDPSLHQTPLVPQTKLVLHRDDPSRVIEVVPLQTVQSRFEIPMHQLHTRLEDLAGVEDIAEHLLEDILLRVCCPETRERFGLEPLKGILLYSYKPGMGKTALMRAIALWLHDHRDRYGFDVALYAVKPNETKSMWHGEDARIIREDLFGAIRARQSLPRQRPLVVLVVLDEIDSLGKRAGRGEATYSSAQSESLEAMLVEMDGLIQDSPDDGPPSYVLCCGLTNRPDRVDEAAKRPGRFSLVVPMPDVDRDGAEAILALYARSPAMPWYLDGQIHHGLEPDVIRTRFLRPALAKQFDEVILHYITDTQKTFEVTAGQLLSNAHYMDAMNRAKKRAAVRTLRNTGIAAVTFEDVLDCLLDVSCEAARQTEADPQMLIRQLDIKVPVARVQGVPRAELDEHRYLRVHSA